MSVDHGATFGFGIILEPAEGDVQYDAAEELCTRLRQKTGLHVGYARVGHEEALLVGLVWHFDNFVPATLDFRHTLADQAVFAGALLMTEFGQQDPKWYAGLTY